MRNWIIGMVVLAACNNPQRTETKTVTADTSQSGNADSTVDTEIKIKHEAFNQDISNVPASLLSFIPNGYTALDTPGGDLNGDAYQDSTWYLHKDGGNSFHATEPEKTTTKIRTTKDFGKVKFEEFDIYAQGSE